MGQFIRVLGNRLSSWYGRTTKRRCLSQELIHGERFLKHPLSDHALHFPAMLGVEERRVLSYLAFHLASPRGKIVDLGCYLGGSTTCLVDGIRQAGIPCDPADPPIVSYDLFVANAFMVEHSLKSFNLQAGQSFEPVFHQLLGDSKSYVRSVAGDLRQQNWHGRPIDLLFVDILWGWDINQHVIEQFYSALIPGRSVVAHQDYIYSFYPWLPISMEYYCEKGYFEFGDLAPWSTVIFGSKKVLDRSALSIDFRSDLNLESKRRLLRRSVERFTGYHRTILELSEVMLILREGQPHEARSLYEAISNRHSEDPITLNHLKMVEGYLAA